jgi:hypothetical protein
MIAAGLICISDIMLVILPDGVDLDPRPGASPGHLNLHRAAKDGPD